MKPYGVLALILLSAIGLGLSAAAWSTSHEQETQAILDGLAGEMAVRARALERELARNLGVLQSLRDLHDAVGGFDRESFVSFTAGVLLRHREIQALEWAPRVAAAERAAFERAARDAGLEGFAVSEHRPTGGLGPAANRYEYFPVLLAEPLAGNEQALGFDLASEAIRADAIEHARETGEMRATPPIRPVREPADARSFLVIVPVYGSEEPATALEGFVVAVIRIPDMVEAAFGGFRPPPDHVRLSLIDDSGPGPEQLLYGTEGLSSPASRAEHRWPLEVAGRRWTLVAFPQPEYFAAQRGWRPPAIFLIGLLLTTGVVACLGVSVSRARAVEDLVEVRTMDLVQANERLDEQRGILQSVLDNLGDGVAVAGADGRLTMFNPAAERILGLGKSDTGPEEWSEFYGLFYPGTTTRIRTDELPLNRALAGVESRDVEMFVRNPERPGGLFIRVTATPLRDQRGRPMGGVAVIRDISERKWAETVLRDSAARFRAIVEATASALIILSPEFRIREFNPLAEQIFGLARARALGQNFLDLCIPAEYRGAVSADVRKIFGGDQTPGFEIPVAAPDGGERTLLWSFSRMAESNDGEAVIIATGHDITERRQAEQSRRVRELASHLQSAREEERRRVAREIHDELGQTLTGLKLEVSFVSRRFKEGDRDIVERLAGVGGMIDGTIESVRRIATDLRPQILDSLGLLEAIRWQSREFEKRTRIPCTLELPEEALECGPDRATALFRIVQEALTNIARHAGASQAAVSVGRQDERIVLEVRDDGCGITPEQVSSSKTFGLLGMQERAREFGGVVRIRPGETRGTTITVSMPY